MKLPNKDVVIEFWRNRPSSLILLIALIVAVAFISTSEETESIPITERDWLVESMLVEKKALRPNIETFGSVLSPQDAELSASIETNVIDVLVRDGDRVREGQPLILLDDREEEINLVQQEANLLELEAKISLAEQELTFNENSFQKEEELFELSQSRQERAKELFDLKRLSKSDFENATESFKRQELSLNKADLARQESVSKLLEFQAQLMRAEALREQALLNVDRATIRAPFDGIVSEPTVSQGDRVRKGDKLMRIQNPQSIEVRTQIPTRYARSISEALNDGDVLPALVSGMNGDLMRGKISRISGLTRQGSGGVDAFITFDDDTIGLRLGSAVNIRLELAAVNDVIAVPSQAVYGRNKLYKISDSRMQSVLFERVGERSLEDGRSEILVRGDSLKDGDRLIVTKLANASEGLLVRENQNASPQVSGE